MNWISKYLKQYVNRDNQKCGNSLIVVAEYPKSGGSWLVSMLGDILDIPKRDVYIHNSHKEQWKEHYWFAGQADIGVSDNCVAKSHELPNSSLHPTNGRYIHMIRDGRDVVVSKYFYEKEFLFHNGLGPEITEPFTSYMKRTAREWGEYVIAWKKSDLACVCRYEELLSDPENTLRCVIASTGLKADTEKIRKAIKNNTKDKMRNELGKMYKYNTFVRKGMARDWLNHFTDSDRVVFNAVAGEAMVALGYVDDLF